MATITLTCGESTMTNSLCKYPYKMSWKNAVLAIVLFGAAFAVLTNLAMGNTQGLVINGIITLDPAGATIFFWSLAIASLIFVLMAVAGCIMSWTRPRFVEMTEEQILLPGNPFQGKVFPISYSDIIDLEEAVVSHQKLLYLHTHEKKHSLAAAMLPNKEAYEMIKSQLVTRMSGK